MQNRETAANAESERALADLIRAERVRFVFIQSAIPIFFSPLAGAILSLALWNGVDRSRLVFWTAGLAVIALMRVALVRSFPRTSPSAFQVRRWERVFVASIVVVDLWWGVGVLFLIPDDLAQRALVFCFIMVMAGGHSASYAAHPATVTLGVLALTLPLTLHFWLQGDVFHTALAFTSVMFLLATFRSVKTLGYFFGHTHRLAHELQREKEQVERLARLDFLTSLNNRRAFYEQCEESLRYAKRYGHATTLLMLDLDHFKAINDRFGHAAGDAVLRTMGARIRETFRSTDIAGRLGGEEFAVLLPETPPHEALAIAERLRSNVEAGSVEHERESISFTISIGVAELRELDSLDQLIARADAALYAAKRTGRNRVVTEPGFAPSVASGEPAVPETPARRPHDHAGGG